MTFKKLTYGPNDTYRCLGPSVGSGYSPMADAIFVGHHFACFRY